MTRQETHARWSWSTGERGTNRVRLYRHAKSGRFRLEWAEVGLDGQRVVRTQSLGHSLEIPAKRAAIAKASELEQRARAGRGVALTLEELFDIYAREVSVKKGRMTQLHDRHAMRLFREYFGASRDPMSLTKRDWDGYIYARQRGLIHPPAPKDDAAARRRRKIRAVRNRVVEQDMRFLLAVLRWAKLSRLIPDVPLEGLAPPTEKSPRRPILTAESYEAMCHVAGAVDPLMPLALILVHETGHRVNAVRLLRWSDFDFDAGTIRWREEHDKSGREHQTPLSAAARAIATQFRGIGDAWLFPSPRVPGQPIGREVLDGWWDNAEALAKLPPERGRGWHSLRRKFGTELMHQPLRVVQELGGWKTPTVLLTRYQQPPLEVQRTALEDRRSLRSATR